MAEIYKVESLTEAGSLLKKFKKSGKYDLFRGQARDWKVKPSISRLGKKESLDVVEQKLIRLYHYFDTNPTFKKFKNDIDWFYAIAQHYGIPTSYIDFTSEIEVALFFATNSKDNAIGETCTIVCLDEKDFNQFIKSTKSIYERDKVIPPYISHVDVDNLWRLQAQKGCFLFTPYSDIEFFYDFDRVIFPFAVPYTDISSMRIYPNRKSELEILLDHYFSSEKRIVGQKRMTEFQKELNIPIITLEPLDYNKSLKKNEVHFSWDSQLVEAWHYQTAEVWKNFDKDYTVSLSFSYREQMSSQIETTISELSSYFNTNQISRAMPLQFEIIGASRLGKKISQLVSKSCSRIWDGTRNLPFSDNEIFRIIGCYLYLEMHEHKLNYTPSLSGEKLITLELTNKYGSVTRCKASPGRITGAFRNDIQDILVDALSSNLSSEILLDINIPQLIFDFGKLVEFFKEEMIAYQVLYNSENDNPVIFYTPTQITVLGYA